MNNTSTMDGFTKAQNKHSKKNATDPTKRTLEPILNLTKEHFGVGSWRFEITWVLGGPKLPKRIPTQSQTTLQLCS